MTIKEKNEDLALVNAMQDENVKVLRAAGRLMEKLEESEQCSAACAELASAMGHLVESGRALEKRATVIRYE